MAKRKTKREIIEVVPREIPPHEPVILRFSAPIGTRKLYRDAAKLERLQHDGWARGVLHRAALAVFDKHGLDTSELPPAHFPRPPRIQPMYDLSSVLGDMDDNHWTRRRAYHADRKAKRLAAEAEAEASGKPVKKTAKKKRKKAATKKKTRKKRAKKTSS